MHVRIQKGDKNSLCQVQIRVAKVSFVPHSDSIVCCIHMSHVALHQLPAAQKVFFPFENMTTISKKKHLIKKKKTNCVFDVIKTDGSLISLSHFWSCCYFI